MFQKVTFTPQVQFTSNNMPAIRQEEIAEQNLDKNQEDKSGLIYGSLAALGAFGLGMLLRKPKVVEKVIERTVQTADRLPKKQTIKHTVPNRNPKPVSLEKQAEVVNNIETSNANSSSRKLAERAIADAPTEAEINAYNQEMRYIAPTADEKNAMALLHSNNKQQRAVNNSVANRISAQEKQTLEAIKSENLANSLKNAAFDLPNGNICIAENGKIVKILDLNTQKGKVVEIVDEKKIAKYLAKNNVDVQDLLKQTPKEMQMAA